jgi:predicted transcriptional regulator
VAEVTAGTLRTAVVAVGLVLGSVAPAAAAGLYSVEPWDVLPAGGDVMASSAVSWWEVAPMALALYALCAVCPLAGQPAHLLYALGGWFGLGFRRVALEGVLSHPLRATVYGYIRTHPGTSFSTIARQTTINRGTLHYHLRILLREGKISELRECGATTYFENNGRYSPEEKRILSRIREGPAGEICRFLGMCRGATRSEIAQRMGVAPSSVSWHLSRLNGSGVILSERTGGKTRYRLTPDAAALHDTYMQESVCQCRVEASN